MAIPLGMKNPKLHKPVGRCGFVDEDMINLGNFKTYRDIFDDTYHFVVPVEREDIPDYVKQTYINIIPGRPSQSEVEKIIYSKLIEERVLVRQLFASSCQNKNGYIVRSQLYSILLKLCPKLKYDQFEIILQKCNLDKLPIYFFETIEKEFKILNVKPTFSSRCEIGNKIKATNALYRLKLATLEESFDLKEILPPSCFEPNALLLMPQLREAMCRINIRMKDSEFYKFWEKFDKLNIGSIPMKYLFQMLNLQDNGKSMCGIRKQPNLKLRQKEISALKRPPITDTYRCLEKHVKEDRSDVGTGGITCPKIQMPGWVPQGMGGTNEPELGKGKRYLAGLNSLIGPHPKYDSVMENLYYIFETPYQAMLVIFHHYDNRNRGKVTIGEALEIFLEYGFSITLKDFATFLKSTGCIFDHSFIKYRKLMDMYQYKPELSYTDRIIKHIIQTQYEDIGLKTLTTMSPIEIEKHFIKVLHKPYMKLMEYLQKKCDQDFTVEENTLREAIATQVLGEAIPQNQWNDVLKILEIDSSTGRIFYKNFLYSFSTPGKKCKPLCPKTPLEVSTEKKWDTSRYEKSPRDLLFLSLKIEKLLKTRFHFIDKYYKYFDDGVLKCLTEMQFFELLRNEKCDITKSELRIVWKIMESVQPDEISYHEVMKFMMTQLTKIARQLKIKERIDSTKGYYDRNIEILKTFKLNQKIDTANEKQKLKKKISISLNRNTIATVKIDVVDIIEKMKPTIYRYWEDIKSYFIQLDIVGSTTVESHQMHTFTKKYFPDLSETELSNLIKTFDINNNGRFHYINFLKEFCLVGKKELNQTKFDCYAHNLVDKKSGKTYPLLHIREILRQSMIKKWKNLLCAFKKLDHCKVGLLNIKQINEILKQNKIFLTDDDLYHVLTNFDRNLDEKIDYYEFIREILDVNLVTLD